MDKSLRQTYRVHSSGFEQWITLALFADVRNASKLRSDATNGAVSAAMLDPTLLTSPFHVLVAVNKALVQKEQLQTKTKNIYSEIIYNLSQSTNISSAFRKFAIKDASENVLLVILHSSRDGHEVNDVVCAVEGTEVNVNSISSFSDTEAIAKEYQISACESEISGLENSVVTRIVARDII
ncbi:hypothetical protein EMCRGX_G007727 [Ephydatia muelleri]